MTLYKIIKSSSVVIDENYTIPVTAEPDLEIEESEEYEQYESEKIEEIVPEPEKEADKIDGEAIKKEIIGRAESQARRTADLIVSHTLETAKSELEGAIARGYSDGFDSGRSEALSVVEPALEKIELLAEAIKQAQDSMLEEFRDEMFNIIAEISQKILRREIDEKDEYLLVLFEDALKDIKAEEFVTVTVSESQAEFALRNIDLFKSKVANIDDFKIIPDKDAGRGTMIVETAKSVADASLEVQLGEVEAILGRMKENLSCGFEDGEF